MGARTPAPAVGMYPANIPVTRSFLEQNDQPDTVRSSLISYDFKHSFDDNWTITNRFLTGRATLGSTDMANNELLRTI